jgi:hypothetical protein
LSKAPSLYCVSDYICCWITAYGSATRRMTDDSDKETEKNIQTKTVSGVVRDLNQQ